MPEVVEKIVIGEYRFKAVTGAKTTGCLSGRALKSPHQTRQISPVTSPSEPRQFDRPTGLYV